MATSGYFARVFGNSPIKPIQQHIEKAAASADGLPAVLNMAAKGDWKEARKAYKRVSKLENDADKLQSKIRLNLPNSLFMPVPRADLLELLNAQDRIANTAQDIAGLIVGRKMQFPESLQDDFEAYLSRSLDAVRHADKVVKELDELYESGFRGKAAELVSDMINTLDAVESDTDKIQIKLRRGLFKLEKNLPSVDVMFMYRVIDWIGDLADHAQSVGSRLELLLAK